MLLDLYHLMPPEGVKILLVLFLSFLTGLEREEHRATNESYSFGGVRTFPLIGLIGYATSLLSGGQVLPVILGFAVVGGFLMLSYRQKLAISKIAGITTEMSALTTYLVGALVFREQFRNILATESVVAIQNCSRKTIAPTRYVVSADISVVIPAILEIANFWR